MVMYDDHVLTTIAATPAKLPSGQWGARAKSAAVKGDTLTIRTKGGKSWDVVVVSVLAGGLLETRSMAGKASTSKPRSASRSYKPTPPTRGCGYPGCNGRNYCDECTDT
jgi:hypothetical protein